jgi:GTPase
MILPPEQNEGNIEYKWKIIDLDPINIQKKITQLKYRIDEGNGEAIYFIGVLDNGTCEGLDENEYQMTLISLQKICEFIDMNIHLIQYIIGNNGKKCGQYLIRPHSKNSYIDLKIGVIGNVDSGKSTLVGVLTKGCLDNGRGFARNHIFNFKHEIDTGRTSSIGHQILGFDDNGDAIYNKKTWANIVECSSKIITFYDLAGHEKYLRTTIYGLSSSLPDYCILVVNGNQGISLMTREHMNICIVLKIPFIIVVTKIDIAPENVLKENMMKLNKMIRNRLQKIPYRIKTECDIFNAIKNIKSDCIIPIFQISNVTNHNLDLMRKFLNFLPIRNDFSQYIHLSSELWIDSIFNVIGYGTVVCGLLKQGKIKILDTMYLGPMNNGEYLQTKIKTIYVKQRDIKEAIAGYYVCCAIKNIPKKIIKKGMVLIGEQTKKISIKNFWAKINVIQFQHTTIKIGYQPFLHIGNIRQVASIIDIIKIDGNNDKFIRTGDKAYVNLEFIHKPEYIKNDMNLVFRDGRMKAFGVICDSPLNKI